MEKRCNSCNLNLTNDKSATSFKCPECNKEEVCRCGKCRKLGTVYVCKCGFEGP
ncbi:RNA-binding protein [Candidatus Woesearchaeota archaeon]|nr:RNA-binding protein [Candidatus Woesearchaeota archaeon]MBT4114643.1 RNA-binding protein [Candidatus Woesearchaeota archaeon]MBT4248015.1 RNA-binding protein [Candidatus Woesearchaeota archaeon]